MLHRYTVDDFGNDLHLLSVDEIIFKMYIYKFKMSLNLLSAMSANTEKYDPLNHFGYRKFRNRGFRGGGGGRKPGGTPWSDPDALHMTHGQHGVGPWDREEDEQIAYERRKAYVEQQRKTRDDPKPKTSDVAGPSEVEMKNNSFQGDVSSVCVNYVL
jgi:hypothetical protein